MPTNGRPQPMRAAAGALLTLILVAAAAACRDAAGAPASGAEPVGTEPQTRSPLPAPPAQFSLAKETQTYLWDVEHLAFVMGQDLVSEFKKAIREGAKDKLRGFLAPDFEARLFAGEGRRVTKGLVTVERWDAGDRVETVGGEAFLDALASYGANFAGHVHVGAHTFYFSPDERGNFDGGWETRWDVHVSGERQDGRRSTRRFDCTLRFSRLSEDMGTERGWVKSFEITELRVVESPRALLEDVTDETGIDVEALADNWDLTGPPYPVVPGFSRLIDFDRDGRVDLLNVDTRYLTLYRGLGNGRFEDVTAAAGLDNLQRLPEKVLMTGGIVADLDNDGREDFLLSIEQITAPGQKAHATLVFRNRGDGSFVLVPEDVHRLSGRFSLLPKGLAAADYDGDGLVDLFLGAVGTPPPEEDRLPRWVGDRSNSEGVLVRNLGGFRFEDVSKAAGLVGERPDIAAATWLDLEPDGDPDLFLANHMGHNVLWENRGDGTFVKRPQPPGYGGFSMGATAGDLDGDGDPDLYVANMYTSAGSRIIDNLRAEDYPTGVYEEIRGFGLGNELYENVGSGPMPPRGEVAEVFNSGWAYGPEVVDLDGDGSLDIYSPAGFQSIQRGKPDG